MGSGAQIFKEIVRTNAIVACERDVLDWWESGSEADGGVAGVVAFYWMGGRKSEIGTGQGEVVGKIEWKMRRYWYWWR